MGTHGKGRGKASVPGKAAALKDEMMAATREVYLIRGELRLLNERLLLAVSTLNDIAGRMENE